MIASAREHWQSIGLDPVAFDAALAGNTPAPPPAPPGGSPAPSADSPGQLHLSVSPQLSDDQAEQMAQALLDAGVSEEKIKAALKADGWEVAPTLTPEEQAELDAQEEHNQHWGYDHHFEPSDYHVNYADVLARAETTTDPDALAQFDQHARSWLADMQMPPELGAALIERGQQVGGELARMDDASKQLWVREQRYLAERMAGGPDQLAEKIRLAGEVVKQAPGAFWDQAVKAGWFHDAWMIMTLANEGSRLEGWRNGGPKKPK